MTPPEKFSFRLAFFTLLALILNSLPSWADWPPISPEDLKMTDLVQQKGAPAVVLLREEFADDPNNYHSVYMRIKILTEAGRRYANVEIPYSRRQFRIDSIRGRTVHADGSIVPFDQKVFDRLVVKGKRGRGEEVRVHVKSFTLPDVQVGSILDFQYSMRYGDHSLFAPEWMIQNELFQKSATFKFIPYSGDVIMAHNRIGRGNAWTSFLPPDAPKPQWHQMMTSTMASSRTANQYIDLNLTNVPPIVEEPFMPPTDMVRYRVQFYYTIDRTSETYWKQEGKFWSKDVEHFLDRKGAIEEAVGKCVLPTDSPEQKVRKIYAFVTTLENQSFRPKREQQEEKAVSLKPNDNAEDVLRERYS